MQPLHVTQLVSEEYPKGDRGGLLYTLHGCKKKNLHLFTADLGTYFQKREVWVFPLFNVV